MKLKIILTLIALSQLFVFQTTAQQTTKPARTEKVAPPASKIVYAPTDAKASFAYAELLSRKTEMEAELQILRVEFTDEATQIVEKRFEIKLLEQALKNLEATTPENLSKLTPAVGKLLVKKIEAEAELKSLTGIYADEHPSIKKAKIRLQIYGDALKKLMSAQTQN